MKKKIFLRTLLLICLVGQFAAHPMATAAPTCSDNAEEGCPAPAPVSLSVVYVTPTTVSLAWIAASPGIYHKIETYDLTASTWLPTVYVSVENYTATGLTPGHCYRFYVSSSYCSGGAFGSSSNVEGCTVIIVTETVVELSSPPSPTTSGKSTQYATHEFCVDLSTQAEPYTNGFLGQLSYNSEPLQFAIGVYATSEYNRVSIGKASSNYTNFNFPSNTSTPSTAICRYNTTPIFTVEVLNSGNSGSVSEAKLSLTFNQACTNFYYGGTVSCGTVSLPAGGHDNEATEAIPDATDRSTEPTPARLHPNPFQQSTTLDYTLATAGPLRLDLYDSQGRLVRTLADGEAEAGTYQFHIPGEDLPAGVYILAVQSARGREVFPLVREP